MRSSCCEFAQPGDGHAADLVTSRWRVIGALIGSVSLTGSIIAWAKLDGRMDKRYTFPGQQAFNAACASRPRVLGGAGRAHGARRAVILAFFVARARCSAC